ncbi:Gfo/Idh/MocA family oxidoreductase [Cryobacterium sp.]|jgi:predicted dehydrogenase|uniref:Gfo/Idh/MocA family protein n=1 Tax=Cryobacterium sp. TaxID=1926290 RepID=UPI00261935C8|nr:Gfo/Idh/MocA family oxidoreductase [Cryobacterium sp.]MCU1445431.1 Oxidoreductase [Cryobacterium sp.]
MTDTAVSAAPRWAILGTGGIAEQTIRDIRLAGTMDVVAVASRTRASADEFAARHSIGRVFDTVDAALESAEVDAVYICTPHSSHFDLARRALLAGKHVLCEKPLTLTAEQSRELATLAAARRLFLMEAMWMVFTPAIAHVQEVIRSGAIGEVRFVESSMGFNFPRTDTSRLWDPDLGGGALLDVGIYPLAFAHLMLGRPETITASGVMEPNGVDLRSTVHLGYADDRSASVSTSMTEVIMPFAVIGGTAGSIVMDPPFFSGGAIHTYAGPSFAQQTTVVPVEGGGYVPMFRAVGEAVAGGVSDHPAHPLKNAIAVLEVIDEVRRTLSASHAADVGVASASTRYGFARY